MGTVRLLDEPLRVLMHPAGGVVPEQFVPGPLGLLAQVVACLPYPGAGLFPGVPLLLPFLRTGARSGLAGLLGRLPSLLARVLRSLPGLLACVLGSLAGVVACLMRRVG